MSVEKGHTRKERRKREKEERLKKLESRSKELYEEFETLQDKMTKEGKDIDGILETHKPNYLSLLKDEGVWKDEDKLVSTKNAIANIAGDIARLKRNN